MANEQYAFLRRDELPSAAALQRSIDNEPRLALTIEFDTRLPESAGFVPCVICGVESGVEIYFEDSSEFIRQFQKIASGRDCCFVFRWGGDMVECACAMVLSYVLAKYHNAVVSYMGEPPHANSEAFRDEIIAVYAHAKLRLP